MSNSVNPWTAAPQTSLSITNSQSLLKLMSIESVMPSNHLILCHPLILLPSTFPIIRVFFNQSALCIMWPKYWSFSFNISSSNEHEGLISLYAQNSPARFQQYVNCELPDVQAGFRKGRGTRDYIANICWTIEKAREFQKNIYFSFIDCAKAFDSVDQNKLENSKRDGKTEPPDLPLEKPVYRSGSNS